jgi:hypothetical protein
VRASVTVRSAMQALRSAITARIIRFECDGRQQGPREIARVACDQPEQAHPVDVDRLLTVGGPSGGSVRDVHPGISEEDALSLRSGSSPRLDSADAPDRPIADRSRRSPRRCLAVRLQVGGERRDPRVGIAERGAIVPIMDPPVEKSCANPEIMIVFL